MNRTQPPNAAETAQANEARELWQNYRAAAPRTDAAHALDMAAYAEGRLRGPARDAVEAYLARNPQALRDVLAARAAHAGEATKAKPSIGRRPSVMDRLGWGAALCAFCLAVWMGFATGEQVASTDNEAYSLYSVAGDDNVDL
jgi:anti-sigma factor RsiW